MVILHTNDLHGKLTQAKAEKIASLRQSADLYFDCGDAVASGNLGIPLSPEPVWNLLALCDCTAGVPGNREFHIAEAGFRAKLAGAQHPVLATNLRWKSPGRPPLQEPQPGTFRLDESAPLAAGLVLGDVGVFGVMVPMVTEKMAAKALSAFVNDSPIAAAEKCVARLTGCSHVICLSHLGLKWDIELAEKVPGIGLILGGHSHDVLEQPQKVRGTWICQTGSHARFVGTHTWDGEDLGTELLPM